MIEASVVRHVARLARLGLDASEFERMQRELSVIIDHVSEIQALRLDDVPVTTHVVHRENVLRDDVPTKGLSTQDALREAPSVLDGGFGVPQIV